MRITTLDATLLIAVHLFESVASYINAALQMQQGGSTCFHVLFRSRLLGHRLFGYWLFGRRLFGSRLHTSCDGLCSVRCV